MIFIFGANIQIFTKIKLMIFKNFVRYSKSKILISFRLFLQPRLIRIEFSRGLPLIINGQKLKRL